MAQVHRWSKGRQPSGAVLHSSCELSEFLAMTLSLDDSTINIVLANYYNYYLVAPPVYKV